MYKTLLLEMNSVIMSVETCGCVILLDPKGPVGVWSSIKVTEIVGVHHLSDHAARNSFARIANHLGDNILIMCPSIIIRLVSDLHNKDKRESQIIPINQTVCDIIVQQTTIARFMMLCSPSKLR